MAITTMTNTTVNAYNALPEFSSLYLAYDDDALKTYANAGLLRRAKKDVDTGKVALSDSVANNSSDNSGGNSTIELISDGQHVILPAKGLIEAQCDCTSVSSCKHIVASVLYLQAVIQAIQTGQATQTGQSSDKHTDSLEDKSTKKTVDTDFTNESKHKSKNQSDALSEILALSLEDIQKIAKKIPKAKRLKAFNMALSYFDSFPINLDSIFDKHDSDNKKPQPNTTIINDSHSLTIQLANQSEPIRYIQGAGFVGMLSKIGRDADSYHLLALLEVKRHYHQYHQPIQQQSRQNADSTTNSKNSFEIIKNWITTTLKSDNNNSNQTPYSAYQLPNDTLAMLDDITFDIHQLLTQGLSNMDSYLANRMHLNNTLARSHHLPRLASQLRQLSGQIHDYSLGSMHASERQILLSLADLSAYIYQLKNSVGDTLIKLRGKLRQRYDNDSKRTDLTLQPLGANWWHSDGKARGLTLYFYEPNEHQIIELTQARAQAQDPSFDKYSAWYHAVWMTSASQLMHQTSTLHNPRFNEDSDFGGANFINASSKLAVTGSHVTHSVSFNQTGNKSDSQTNFSAYLHRINAIAYDDWATLEQDWRQQMLHSNSGDGIAPVVVLNPAKIGALLIDEIEQCVWWQLQDEQDNQIRLRLDWNSNEHTSIAKIKKLERLNLHDIQMVVARVGFNNGTSSNCIELAPVSLVMQHDLFHLDYDDVPNKKHTLKDLLSGKISKLMSKKRRLIEIESNKSTTPTTLTQLVCEPILDVLDSLCASGRLQPTSNQLNTLRQQYKLASDAGLSILASAIKPVFEDSIDNSTDYSNNHITDAGMNDSIKDTAKTQDKDRLQPILKLAYLCKQMQFLQIEMPIFSDNY